MTDARRPADRRLAYLIIALVVLLPLLGVISAVVWGDDAPEQPTELPGGSGGGLGG